MAHDYTSHTPRPEFPSRAVITAGMPYGNKDLHFGHMGGVFIPADFYARFMRDRIGAQNVIFVSGTDCYGSPIEEGYRKRVEAGFEGTITDYVRANHESQKAALEAYDVSLDLFSGSGLEPAKTHHTKMGAEIMMRLHEKDTLERRETMQFYDKSAGKFLNGRQVLGHCPVAGCKSSKAYADECEMGHQYDPSDLIAPKSALTGETPEMRPVANWYFDLPTYRTFLTQHNDALKNDPTVRSVVTKTTEEFLGDYIIFIKNDIRDEYEQLACELPAHSVNEPEKGKQSFGLKFETYQDRDAARDILADKGIRFRTSKALVPFRITGNIKWGVPAPALREGDDLTFWCWPESLWAPISFTDTLLAQTDPQTHRYNDNNDWRQWWESEDAQVYQFIGQDNIYFYCVAQPAIWNALDEGLRQSTVVANHHILFMNKKASSSSDVKPPMAHELLDFYTPEQLRAHWLSLGLGMKAVSFSPKPYDAEAKDNPRAADPALKEGALLTNVFNRLARSCFYGVQKYNEGMLPSLDVFPEVIAEAQEALKKFELHTSRFEFHTAMAVSDAYIRSANKRWADESKAAGEDIQAMKQALANALASLRWASIMMHPAVPKGCEKIAEHMNIAADAFFGWENVFMTPGALLETMGIDASTHKVVELPPRFDFFSKHASQYKK